MKPCPAGTAGPVGRCLSSVIAADPQERAMETGRTENASKEVGGSTWLFWSFVPRKLKKTLYLRHWVVFNIHPRFQKTHPQVTGPSASIVHRIGLVFRSRYRMGSPVAAPLAALISFFSEKIT